MASENMVGTTPMSFLAGGTITKNAALKLSAANTVVVTTAITELVIGFAMTSAVSGQSVDVMTVNGSKVKAVASAAISVGAEVMPNANGAVTTAAGATAVSCGIANEAAGAAGDIIEVIFRPMVRGPLNA